ncbi:MAG TPA: DciA family protein [Actinocrinis sp.]|nr:DciA family protein [Actinocrinis sp.]
MTEPATPRFPDIPGRPGLSAGLSGQFSPPAEPAPGPDERPVPRASGADLAKAALAAARKRAREAEQAAARLPGPRRNRFTGAALGHGARGGRHSGSGPDDRDPQTLQATMGRLLAESGWEEPAAVGGVIHGWADLVGARIAAHCVPVSFAEGVLTVQTDSTAWATELRNLSTQLLTRLNAAVPSKQGGQAISRLAVQGPNPPSWRHGRLSVPGRGPRDTYG